MEPVYVVDDAIFVSRRQVMRRHDKSTSLVDDEFESLAEFYLQVDGKQTLTDSFTFDFVLPWLALGELSKNFNCLHCVREHATRVQPERCIVNAEVLGLDPTPLPPKSSLYLDCAAEEDPRELDLVSQAHLAAHPEESQYFLCCVRLLPVAIIALAR